MKKIAYAAFTSAAALALAACGGAEEASQDPMADNVETMAEEPIADETMADPLAEDPTAATPDAAATADPAAADAEAATDQAM